MGVTALGGWALVLAAAVAVASAVMSADGQRRGRASSVDWGRRGLVAVFGLVSGGIVALGWALIGQDYSLVYVADHASRDTTWPYRLAGLWGGMAGSLLLWTWMLAGWSVVAARSVRRRLPTLAGATQAVLAVEAAVFLGLLVTVSRPFATLAVPAIDGGGLTPILRHPAMLYHPPLLYAGYVGLAVPAAVAVAALAARASGAAGPWLAVARRFMVASLVLLAVGMTAGAHWAYVELGWGGYWAWDPVENGALLPWLAGIAFLHAALVAAGDAPRPETVATRPKRAADRSAAPGPVAKVAVGDAPRRETVATRPKRAAERSAAPGPVASQPDADVPRPETVATRLRRAADRSAAPGPESEPADTAGLRRVGVAIRPQRDKDRSGVGLGTVGLAFLAFALSLLGAFLTRSGVTGSVHAFAEARAVGRTLLAGLAVTAVGLVALMIRRRGRGDHDHRPTHTLTRDEAVRVNNGLLLAVIVVVGFGLLYPVLTGDDLVVTGRYFAVVTAPLALGLLAAIGVGPRLGLRPRPWPELRTRLRPAWWGVAALAAAALGLDDRRPVPLALIGLAGSAAALTIAEWRSRARPTAGRPTAARPNAARPTAAGDRAAAGPTAAAPTAGVGRGGGGLLAHLGVAVLLAGVAGTATGTHARASLVPGQTITVRGHTLRLEGVEPVAAPDGGRAARAVLTVDGGRTTLRPVALVAASGDRVSEAALRSTPVEDLQVALRTVSSGGGAVVIDVFVVPLAQWVWWGALLTAAGIAVIASRDRGPDHSPRRRRDR